MRPSREQSRAPGTAPSGRSSILMAMCSCLRTTASPGDAPSRCPPAPWVRGHRPSTSAPTARWPLGPQAGPAMTHGCGFAPQARPHSRGPAPAPAIHPLARCRWRPRPSARWPSGSAARASSARSSCREPRVPRRSSLHRVTTSTSTKCGWMPTAMPSSSFVPSRGPSTSCRTGSSGRRAGARHPRRSSPWTHRTISWSSGHSR